MKQQTVFACLLLLAIACSQSKKDQGVKEMLSSTAKEEPSFVGINYTVKDGVVTLSGNAPTDAEKSRIEQRVKSVSGVKDVVNQITIAPVVLDADHVLKQSVDSVLKKYPTVQAVVQDSVITLQGSIDSKKAVKLFNTVQRLKAKGVTNELVITSVSQDANAAK